MDIIERQAKQDRILETISQWMVSRILMTRGRAMKMDGVRLRAKKMGIKTFRRKKMDIIRDIQTQEGNTTCYQDKTIDYCDQFHCCWRDDCRPAGEKAEA